MNDNITKIDKIRQNIKEQNNKIEKVRQKIRKNSTKQTSNSKEKQDTSTDY